MKIHFILAASISFFLSGAGLIAQEAIHVPMTEEVEVSLVSLYAAVRDSRDRPVKGLKQDDFVLTQSGKPVEITQFSGDPTEPASVAFLVDISGSMRLGDKYGIGERLVDAVLERLQADDEAALITFGDEQVKTAVELTTDKSKVSNALASQKLWGPTALWDAIVYSQKMVVQSYGKKVVILISDGFDNRSESVFKRAVEEASKIELPVYVCEIVLEDEFEMREMNFASPLKDFAEATGALHFDINGDSDKEIKKVAERLVEEIRYQYYIGIPGGSIGANANLQLVAKNNAYRVRLRHGFAP